MDGHGFDAIAKALAHPGAPRRRVLRALAGGAVAGLGAILRGAAAPRLQSIAPPTPTPTTDPTPSPTPACPCPCPPQTCPPGQTQDPVTCQCRCPEVECPPGQTLDPSTCQCRCPCPCPQLDCPSSQVQDPVTCQCVCPPGHTLCVDVCCPARQTCVNGQCRGDVCPVASTCDEKHYCGEDEECLCIRTPEGEIRCGRPPACVTAPRCASSADCAHLGVGYFCDTPNSGCCDEQYQRCLAPCDATCRPDCTGKECGDDGCGGSCGDCTAGTSCENGRCVERPTQQIYCFCNDTCYSDAVSCTTNCKATLACFTGICRPALPGDC